MIAYVGLGSNLGDRLDALRRAVAALDAVAGVRVTGASPVYETDPLGPPQPDFLNAVVRVETTLDARSLLAECKRIEQRLGRERSERWGPRTIDLDLLLYGDDVVDEPGLRVPHPEMTRRAFVLVPLAALDADVEVPGAGRAGTLAAVVGGRPGVRAHPAQLR